MAKSAWKHSLRKIRCETGKGHAWKCMTQSLERCRNCSEAFKFARSSQSFSSPAESESSIADDHVWELLNACISGFGKAQSTYYEFSSAIQNNLSLVLGRYAYKVAKLLSWSYRRCKKEEAQCLHFHALFVDLDEKSLPHGCSEILESWCLVWQLNLVSSHGEFKHTKSIPHGDDERCMHQNSLRRTLRRVSSIKHLQPGFIMFIVFAWKKTLHRSESFGSHLMS